MFCVSWNLRDNSQNRDQMQTARMPRHLSAPDLELHQAIFPFRINPTGSSKLVALERRCERSGSIISHHDRE